MDAQCFDDLVRLFATGSRRRFLITLGGAAGLLLGVSPRRSGDAAVCRKAGKVCREHANCCSGLCGPKNASGRRVCVCPQGTEDCDGDCLDPATYQTDPANCGGCGQGCSLSHAIEGCAGGQCTIAACAAGYANCDGMAANGCETPLGTDQNCTACGDTCQPNEACDPATGCYQVCELGGSSCASGAECCSQSCKGTCQKVCQVATEACDPEPCCEGHDCIGGVCVQVLSLCKPLNQSCSADECCAIDGLDCVGGTCQKVCQVATEQCDPELCCEGHDCIGGTCVQILGLCKPINQSCVADECCAFDGLACVNLTCAP